MRRLIVGGFGLFLLAYQANAQQQATVTVPAIADISLAGQAAGARNGQGCGRDSSPLNSPVPAAISVVPGQALQFGASGSVDTSGRTPPTTPPDGDPTWYSTDTASSSLGIGTIAAPSGALIGVFLGPDPPSAIAPPPAVDFSGAAKDLPLLRPLLRQPFFIGSGLTSGGTRKTFVMPSGASRVFLAVMDRSSCNSDNTGSFQVTVTAIGSPPVPPANPVLVPAIADIMLAGQPDGVTNTQGCGRDSSPLDSAVQASGFAVSGRALQFSVTGSVDTSGRTPPTTPPDGDPTWYSTDTASSSLGIGTIAAPSGALIGVFLGSGVPSPTAPASVDFSGGARDLAQLSPLLQQPFFIGSGLTSSGTRKSIIPPAGGTRLFLGVMDRSSCNSDNTGSFQVTVAGLAPFEPRLTRYLSPGFYILEATLAPGASGGFWGLEVLTSLGQSAGGFNLGGALYPSRSNPGFGAFALSTPQTVTATLNAQPPPGTTMEMRFLDSNRQQIGGSVSGSPPLTLSKSLSPGFYIVEVWNSAAAPATYQLGLAANFFSGGVDTGGFLDKEIVGFGAFYVPAAQNVTMMLYGQATYGTGGAGSMILTLKDSQRNVLEVVRP